MIKIILYSAILIFHSTALFSQSSANEDHAYLLYYFEGYAGEKAGLYVAYSYDLHTWHKLGEKLIQSETGEFKVFRDPCVLLDKKGVFHLCWTTGRSGFGYANSKDGLKWKNQRFVIVKDSLRGYDFANVWAPEFFYENDTVYIIWSSTLKKDYIPPKEAGKWWTAHYDHRFFYTKTTDFKTFAPTQKFWDPGFNAIDAAIINIDGIYYNFFKDERKTAKNIVLASSDKLFGPYESPQNITYKLTEGAIPLKTDTALVLYYDFYHEYNGYRYITSADLQSWSAETLPEKDGFSDIFRHGSIVRISKDRLRKMVKNIK